jgi:uracil-DNA glycosylase family 4
MVEPPESPHIDDSLCPTAKLDRLAVEAAACSACARMAERSAVLGRLNGPVSAKVLFIAEAPGRFGADRTRQPLVGDRSGRNFEAFLQNAGIRRQDVFVTNAVLCNPRDGAGRNTTPNTSEIRNCSAFLEETLRIIDPLVVVTLGTVALRALELIAPHGAVLRKDVATPVWWNSRWLIPLYHPGARALIHRSFSNQGEDYIRLARHLEELNTEAFGDR